MKTTTDIHQSWSTSLLNEDRLAVLMTFDPTVAHQAAEMAAVDVCRIAANCDLAEDVDPGAGGRFAMAAVHSHGIEIPAHAERLLAHGLTLAMAASRAQIAAAGLDEDLGLADLVSALAFTDEGESLFLALRDVAGEAIGAHQGFAACWGLHEAAIAWETFLCHPFNTKVSTLREACETLRATGAFDQPFAGLIGSLTRLARDLVSASASRVYLLDPSVREPLATYAVATVGETIRLYPTLKMSLVLDSSAPWMAVPILGERLIQTAADRSSTVVVAA